MLGALALTAALAAAPDLSLTIVVSPATPHEGDVVEFSVVVRNAGPDDAEFVQITAEWPRMGFLVATTGTGQPQVDHESRTVTFPVPLARGASWPFTVRVLAPRDSGGDTLTLAVRALHGPTMTEARDDARVSIDTRPAPAAFRLGGLGIAPAAAVLGALAVAGGLLWLLLAAFGTGRPGAAVAVLTLAAAFWTLFATMAWRDYRSITVWRETTCTVLGGRLSAQGTTRTRRAGAATSVDETTFVPVLGLRYTADGTEIHSSGYDTGSRLGRGPAGGRTGELGRWAVGAETPCWYDPDDPRDVVVRRGFGGAYLFAIFPLPVFLAGLSIARSRRR